MLVNTAEYLSIIENIKSEITAAQYRAAVHVNADMLLLYYDIGCVINEHKSWGNKFIDNLAADIRIAFPESKGYSVRNLKYMAKFAEIYPDREFVQQLLANYQTLDLPCRTSFSMESGFLYPEAVFPVSAKRDVIQLNTIDIIADYMVYYVID